MTFDERVLKMTYEFLSGYKQNSGIYINNFFRKRTYEEYVSHKFHGFDFDVSGIMPNVFDDFSLSMNMVSYLGKLEDNKFAYFPIEEGFIIRLIALYNMMKKFETKEDMIVYRGCNSLERNGVNGLVSTTTDIEVAKQFNRGALLTIHLPKGSNYLDVKEIRPEEQKKKDKENEILISPCDYEIISRKIVREMSGFNNSSGVVDLVELVAKPKNLLKSFLEVMDDPIEEYFIINEQKFIYNAAYDMLKHYIGNIEN